MTRPCRICGAPTPEHRRERYCSPECRLVTKESQIEACGLSYGASCTAPRVPSNASENNPKLKTGVPCPL
jgi:hypothetical protein